MYKCLGRKISFFVILGKKHTFAPHSSACTAFAGAKVQQLFGLREVLFISCCAKK